MREMVRALALGRAALMGGLFLAFFFGPEAFGATFVVTSYGEGSDAIPGDGVAEIQPGTGITTFHAAIEEANAFPGPDIIRINLPFNAICGDCKVPCIVRLQYQRPLPAINDPTGGTYIELSGDDLHSGVQYMNGSRHNPALGPEGFNAAFVFLSAGNTLSRANIANYPGDGVVVSGPGASGNTIISTRVGQECGGYAGVGGDGIRIEAGASVNVISECGVYSSGGYGIRIVGGGSDNNLVRRCKIGGEHTNRLIVCGYHVDKIVEPILLDDSDPGCMKEIDSLISLMGRDQTAPNRLGQIVIADGASFNQIGGEGEVLPDGEREEEGNAITGSFWHKEYALNGLVDCSTPDTNPPPSRGSDSGVIIEGPGTNGNRVQGNTIGYRESGLITRHEIRQNGLVVDIEYYLHPFRDMAGFGFNSVAIRGGASNNIIGHESDLFLGNKIGWSYKEAVLISGPGTAGNMVAHNTIRALGDGVGLEAGASGNFIGLPGGNGNSIHAREYGVEIAGGGTSENVVVGNMIARNGYSGVAIRGGASNNRIGGVAPDEGNILSENCSDGVVIFDPDTDGNQILGNEIADNGEIGVFIVNGASDNIIGGSTPGAGNDIHSNAVTGVEIHDIVSTGNRILGNDIHGNGTRGVFMVDGTSGNIVGGVPLAERNRIYENELSGIEINGAATVENQIRLNSIFDNKGKGIFLNFGANKGVLPPSIQSFIPFAGTAPPNSFVDIFSDAAEEGKHYIGSTSTDGDGNFSVTTELKPYGNTNLTATATDDQGNTSEFSLPIAIIPPTFSETPSDRVVVEHDDFTLLPIVAGSPVIEFQWRFRTPQGSFDDLVDTDRVTGSRTDALSLVDAQFSDQGYYQCVADNGLGAVYSREIFVRVIDSEINELEVNSLGDTSDGNTTSFARLLTDPGPDGVVSLREAILAANEMGGRNIVRFSVAGIIQLETELPAIDDATGGLLMDGMGGVILDGSLLEGSGSGLRLFSDGNEVTGLTIQGFPEHGIVMNGVRDNIVTACKIGTDGQSAMGNGIHGIFITDGATANRIGGTASGDGNHIAGNLNSGVALSGAGTGENRILGNIIGQNAEGLPGGGNAFAGIYFYEGASGNNVGGDEPNAANRIVGNDGIGVWVVGGSTTRNTLVGNTIFGNGDLGIRLFEGGNENILRPEITAVSPLRGTAPAHSRVDCYVDGQDEGETFLITLTADANGLFTEDIDMTAFDGRYLTAIATDQVGNTSAFSRPSPIDFSPPVMTLLGEENVSLECGTTFDDPGASAIDNIDGNLFLQVEKRIEAEAGHPIENLAGAGPGNYTIHYNVSDTAGLAATPVSRVVTIIDTTPPVLTLSGAATVSIVCGEVFEDPGATAQDTCDSAPEILVSGTIDQETPGEYTLSYSAADAFGNISSSVTRKVIVEDQVAPVITLNGPAIFALSCGEPFIDPGATAMDDCAGELEVERSGAVDVATPGEYVVTYRASDAAGNHALELTRTVIVADTTAPVLTVVGEADMVLRCAEGYVERGATASDACDPVAKVIISGDLDPNAVGVYTLYYDVTDASGNVAETVTRTITVVGETPPRITLTGSAEVSIACNGVYADAGASAVDGCQSDIGARIVTENPVNTAVPGTYIVTYNVVDGAGASAAEVTRTVTVLPCVAPCDTRCSGGPDDRVDADGDGLSACKEQCFGSSDRDPDSDNDGMADGFEYRYQLNPRVQDGDLDLDLDGLTNLEEYLEGSSPRDGADPMRTFYVAQHGIDETTAGSSASPWRSLAYALGRLQSAPAGRNQLFIESGVYVEDITLPPHVVVRSAPGANVEIMGSVIAPSNSSLRDVTLSSDGADTALMFISGSGVTVTGCTFNGEFGQNLTGLVVEAGVTGSSLIEGSVFSNLAVGIAVEGALPHVRQCLFMNITGAGILLLPDAVILEDSPAGEGLNGWNDFGLIGGGVAVRNQSAAAVAARWNDWGTDDPLELELLIEGDVDQGDALAEGDAGSAASLEIVVFNGETQARIRNAQVNLTGGALNLSGVTDANGRLAFPLLNAGAWQVVVTASGLPGASESLNLSAGTYRVANFALIPEVVREEPRDGGCPSPGKAGAEEDGKRGDLVLLTFLLAGLFGGKVAGRRYHK